MSKKLSACRRQLFCVTAHSRLIALIPQKAPEKSNPVITQQRIFMVFCMQKTNGHSKTRLVRKTHFFTNCAAADVSIHKQRSVIYAF